MINYLVTADRAYTIKNYLDHWGINIRHLFRVISYTDLWLNRTIPGGSYIFSDLERLVPAERVLAHHIYDVIVRNGCGVSPLNNPVLAADRITLLGRLWEARLNDFKAHKVTSSLRDVRYPVFLRESNDHRGSLSGLLRSPKEVDIAVARAVLRGFPLESLLLIEYCNTADSGGIYRKYSYFKINDALIPRHILFSKGWLLKFMDLESAHFLQEERIFLDKSPNRFEVGEIFRIAQIDYGRIDYSIDNNNKIQTWEINTNPTLLLVPTEYSVDRFPLQQAFAERLQTAFESFDSHAQADEHQFTPHEALLRLAAQQREYAKKRSAFPRIVRFAGNYPTLIRPLGWFARRLSAN